MTEREKYAPDPQKEGHNRLFTKRQVLVNTLYALGAVFSLGSVHQSVETNRINTQLAKEQSLTETILRITTEESGNRIRPADGLVDTHG